MATETLYQGLMFLVTKYAPLEEHQDLRTELKENELSVVPKIQKYLDTDGKMYLIELLQG